MFTMSHPSYRVSFGTDFLTSLFRVAVSNHTKSQLTHQTKAQNASLPHPPPVSVSISLHMQDVLTCFAVSCITEFCSGTKDTDALR
jgi:hypothetical protein